jgi:hypothetical protein
MIDYFIIGHNEFVLENAFEQLPNVKKILVGEKHTHINKTICCLCLKDNLEHFPKLCSFTGWYAISRNFLYTNDIISLLEYDVMLSNSFHDINLSLIESKSKNNFVISYNKTLTNHYVFYKSTPWLELSLLQTYGINLMDFVESVKNRYPYWPTTTNITMSSNVLFNFIEWFLPMTKYFNHDILGSYVHERAFFIYCVLHDIDIIYAPLNTLTHKQLCSHGYQDIYGKFLATKNSTTLLDSYLSEYDVIYDKCMLECGRNLK